MIKKITSPSATIIVFSIYLSFLYINAINVAIPVFSLIVTSGLLLKKHVKQEIWIWMATAAFLLSTLVVRYEETRISSTIYSCMFFVIAISFFRGIHGGALRLDTFMKICRLLVMAYFCVLLIQQLCLLAGLPIFNVMLDYSKIEGSKWKLSSLSDEPSHAARIVALLTFSYIGAYSLFYRRAYSFIEECRKHKSERFFWFAFFWTMITMQSSTALLFVAIILFRFFLLGKAIIKSIIVGVFCVLVAAIAFGNNKLIKRNIDIITATLTMGTKAIVKADNSGAHRIVPIIILAERVELLSINGLFGFGMDTSKTVVYRNFPGWMDENVAGGGGVFQIWYDFGAIVFLLYVVGTFKYCTTRKDKLSYLFWFLLIFVNTLNTQITWLAIMLLAANKYFINRYNKSRSRHYETNRF